MEDGAVVEELLPLVDEGPEGTAVALPEELGVELLLVVLLVAAVMFNAAQMASGMAPNAGYIC